MNMADFEQMAPEQAAAFRQLRRLGADRADLCEFDVAGVRRRLWVDVALELTGYYLTTEAIDGPGARAASFALRVVDRTKAGIEVDPHGDLLRAMLQGHDLEVPGEVRLHTWHILPVVTPPKLLLPARRRIW